MDFETIHNVLIIIDNIINELNKENSDILSKYPMLKLHQRNRDRKKFISIKNNSLNQSNLTIGDKYKLIFTDARVEGQKKGIIYNQRILRTTPNQINFEHIYFINVGLLEQSEESNKIIRIFSKPFEQLLQIYYGSPCQNHNIKYMISLLSSETEMNQKHHETYNKISELIEDLRKSGIKYLQGRSFDEYLEQNSICINTMDKLISEYI